MFRAGEMSSGLTRTEAVRTEITTPPLLFSLIHSIITIVSLMSHYRTLKPLTWM